MSDRETMLKLADACEAATGADRELDYTIGYLEGVHNVEPDMQRFIMLRSKVDNKTPAYTASLDAAMTLVPEGLSWEVRSSGTGDKGQATVWDPMRAPTMREWRVTGCTTPALALCAAALHARAATLPVSSEGE